MKTERSMGTLMTVFSGVAALLCLLSGLQLFALESQIDQASDNLTEGAGEFRKTALRDLQQHDGIGHGHPYREIPP